MKQETKIDLEEAHRFFSVDCFNRTWDFIDKPKRNAQEEQSMLSLSIASLWHWTQRSDVTPTNLSVGYWQVARVFALMGQAENARLYGQLSLAESHKEGVAPFYLGYSYEALARAEALGHDREKLENYKQLAREACNRIADENEKQMLLADLGTI